MSLKLTSYMGYHQQRVRFHLVKRVALLRGCYIHRSVGTAGQQPTQQAGNHKCLEAFYAFICTYVRQK